MIHTPEQRLEFKILTEDDLIRYMCLECFRFIYTNNAEEADCGYCDECLENMLTN